MANKYFPLEFFQEILLRLPAKSLCRFRSVNKSFNSQIKSQLFINSHLSQNLNSDINSHLLLRISDLFSNKENFLFYPYYETRTRGSFGISSLPIIPQLNITPRIVGICNGLICFIDDFDNNDDAQIVLWNPSIKKSIILPNPKIKLKFPEYFAIGFGVDSLNSDYKVVRIVYLVKGGNSVGVEVFSLRTMEWRRIEDVRLDCFLPPPTGIHACVNDRVHWIGWRKEGGSQSLIVYFDMRDEVFGEISLPGGLAGELSFDLVLSVERGCLAVSHCVPSRQSYLSLWVMKEYGVAESWTIMFNLDDLYLMRVVEVSMFSKNDDILIRRSSNRWARYDPENRRMMYLGLYGLGSLIHADKYQESLVLLEHEGLDHSHNQVLLEHEGLDRSHNLV